MYISLMMLCPFSPYSVDVLSTEVWPLLSNLDDPELRRLAKALPATVLKCKADSTGHKEISWSLSEVEDMGRGQTGDQASKCRISIWCCTYST